MTRLLAFVLLLALSPCLRAQEPAPDFSLKDLDGAQHSKSSCAGSVTVLEWVNYDCPFVKKYYSSGTLPRLQQRFTGKGVKWLSVSSNTEGHPGNLSASSGRVALAEAGGKPSALLLDPEAQVAKAFGARRTPFVVVLDPRGRIVYRGGFDAEVSFDPKSIDPAVNYVADALEQTLLGKPVKRPSARNHGCSIR